jgi:thymidylate kinase
LSSQPLLVEFIGVPGAGKTTIAQVAIENLNASGYRCFGLSTLDKPETKEKLKGGILSKLRTTFQFALSCIIYPRIAIDALRFVMQVKPVNFNTIQRYILFMARLKFFSSLIEEDFDFIILDQGLIQYIWSIAVSGEEPTSDRYLAQLVNSLLDEMPLFVILVDIETELAIERIVNRPTMRSRFDRMAPSMAEVWLSTHKEVFSKIIESTGEFKSTGYLNVSGDQPVNTNIGLIIPFIQQARQASTI